VYIERVGGVIAGVELWVWVVEDKAVSECSSLEANDRAWRRLSLSGPPARAGHAEARA
jgi:hypothetical protein